MDSPVTERMCQERHSNLGTKIDETKDEVIKIGILWNGNGKIGAGQKIDTMWRVYLQKQKSTQGWVDWAFRLIIVLVLGWLGLK